MSKVLVTGGAGFIGSKMVNRLRDEGFDVVSFDLSSRMGGNPITREVEIYEGDILNIDAIISAVTSCDYVVHFAGALGVQATEEQRLACLEVNIQGTRNVLEACVKKGVKKVIFSSSSEVYGQQTKFPISEDNPLNASSVYAISKLAGEEYIKAYKKHYDLDYSILRFFNVYGEGQRLEFVISKFVNMVLNNKPPTIYGAGEQVRSFCYVDDVVPGAILALTNPKANSQTFNIGNDKEPISVSSLAYKVISLAGRNMEPKFISLGSSDRKETREISKRIPDISKARDILAYEPSVSLSEGILRVIEYGGHKL